MRPSLFFLPSSFFFSPHEAPFLAPCRPQEFSHFFFPERGPGGWSLIFFFRRSFRTAFDGPPPSFFFFRLGRKSVRILTARAAARSLSSPSGRGGPLEAPVFPFFFSEGGRRSSVTALHSRMAYFGTVRVLFFLSFFFLGWEEEKSAAPFSPSSFPVAVSRWPKPGSSFLFPLF